MSVDRKDCVETENQKESTIYHEFGGREGGFMENVPFESNTRPNCTILKCVASERRFFFV